ncbi:MAG: hypothetical protein ACKN9T_02095 [Candidatus Methylumidiphilus sp.]
MRALIHLPIIHGAGDLGSLGGSAAPNPEQAQRQAAVEQFWTVVETAIASFGLDYAKLKIYQDGLPVCGKEAEIVAETAQSGSRNFQLLQALQAKGATVIGTESPQLLLEEYALMRQTLNPEAGQPPPTPAQAQALLDKRDEYIAQRIADTLQDEEMGLLFLGLLHNIEAKLPQDIKLIQPLGKPKLG